MPGSTKSPSNVPVTRRLEVLFGVPAMVEVLALGACGKDEKKSSGATEATGTSGAAVLSGDAPVEILNFEFNPQKATVKPGPRSPGQTATPALTRG